MAKMEFSREERPIVKLECLKMLATMRLYPARMQLISGFVDTYLRLNTTEEQTFQTQLNTLGLTQEEQVMEIVTSWMEKGIERGLEQGKQQGEINLILRQLNRRLGSIPAGVEEQIRNFSLEKIEALGFALLDFSTESDLLAWLDNSE